jgi:bacillopeptidase F (M6 metalloprotease family)
MDLPIDKKPLLTIVMNYDNQMVVAKIDNFKDNMKSSRHIKRGLKSVRKMRNSRVITMDYIQTKKNIDDLFTNGLLRSVIDAASKEMGLRLI